MVQLGEYVQIISAIIYASALIITVLQLSAMRKSMLIQGMQQTFATTTQVINNNLNSKEYFEMAQESPTISEYYSLVGSPRAYYLIIQNLDMFEYVYHLYKKKMIDMELWSRWEASARSMMTVPKVKKVWDKTKNMRSKEFRELMDSFSAK